MNKQLLNFGLRIIVSVSLLVLLLTRIEISSLITSIQGIDIGYLLAAIVSFILYIFLWAGRWQLFINDTKIVVPFLKTVKTLLIGFAIALFLPSAVGTDIGRTFDMARSEEQKLAIVSTVLMDRLLGLLTVVGMALVAIAIIGYQYLNEGLLVGLVAVAVIFGVGWMLFFNKSLMRRFVWTLDLPIINRFAPTIKELYSTIYEMQRKRRLFLTALVVSILTVMAEIVAVIMLSYALGAFVDPVFFFFFMPIVWVILIVPISLGGLGIREAVFSFFFTQVGMVASDAIALSLLYYTLYAVTGIAAGIFPLVAGILSSMQNLARPEPQDT